jgi:hypothetical protein
MNNKNFIQLIICVALFSVGCSKGSRMSQELTQDERGSVLMKTNEMVAKGMTQISGVGFYATADECSSPQGQGAAYIVKFTGDLEGCLYAFVDDYECSPSGTYREEGREYFVGTYKGETGTFWTTYKFESKYEGCANNGAPLGAEIFGRCQHPIADGFGTGVFEGVTGQINMKDNVELGEFPYRGHLAY